MQEPLTHGSRDSVPHCCGRAKIRGRCQDPAPAPVDVSALTVSLYHIRGVRKMKKAGSLLRLPAPESNAALAVAAPALRFPASVDEDGVSRYAASRDYSFIIPHTRAKSRGEGRKIWRRYAPASAEKHGRTHLRLAKIRRPGAAR